MTQAQLVKEFIKGVSEGNNDGKHNLVIRDGKLMHYYTLLGQHYDGKIIVNLTRYSLVTGRIQKMLKEQIPEERLIIAKRVPEGTKDSLIDYIAK